MYLIAGFITNKRRGIITDAGGNCTSGSLEIMNLAIVVIEYFKNTAVKKKVQAIMLRAFNRQKAAVVQAVLVKNWNTPHRFTNSSTYFRTHYFRGAYDTL